MTNFLSIATLLAASTVSALTQAERVGAIALEIGAPLPEETPVVIVPDVFLQSGEPAVASGYVSGSGYLSGSAFLFCSASPNSNGSGWMNGSMNLTANIPVYGPAGISGTIPVAGFISLSGSCQNGAGYVTGSTMISGSGTMYGHDGKRVGTARLSGTVFVNQYVSSQYVWINQHASLTGRFDTD